MAKYIKCDCCGKRIEFGDDVYKFTGYAGLYCSADCFADAYGEAQELDDELANDCYKDIYDDETEMAIIQEILSVKADMQILQERLKDLECALEICTNTPTTQNE